MSLNLLLTLIQIDSFLQLYRYVTLADVFTIVIEAGRLCACHVTIVCMSCDYVCMSCDYCVHVM